LHHFLTQFSDRSDDAEQLRRHIGTLAFTRREGTISFTGRKRAVAFAGRRRWSVAITTRTLTIRTAITIRPPITVRTAIAIAGRWSVAFTASTVPVTGRGTIPITTFAFARRWSVAVACALGGRLFLVVSGHGARRQ
jgi:hypothetical protein